MGVAICKYASFSSQPHFTPTFMGNTVILFLLLNSWAQTCFKARNRPSVYNKNKGVVLLMKVKVISEDMEEREYLGTV